MVTIFGKGDCSSFDRTKVVLSLNGCSFIHVHATLNNKLASLLKHLLHKSSEDKLNKTRFTDSSDDLTKRPAPDLHVFFGDTYVGGFEELCVLFEEEKIQEMYRQCTYIDTSSTDCTKAKVQQVLNSLDEKDMCFYMSAVGVPNLVKYFEKIPMYFDSKINQNKNETNTYTYSHMLYTCILELPRTNKKLVNLGIHPKCFKGETFVDFCKTRFNIEETHAINVLTCMFMCVLNMYIKIYT